MNRIANERGGISSMNPADKYERLYCATCAAPVCYMRAGELKGAPVYCNLCAQDVAYTLTQLHVPGYQQFIDMVNSANAHDMLLKRWQEAGNLLRNLNQFIIDKNS